jgi:asparagine synthase (glutamine-hydrolysing)
MDRAAAGGSFLMCGVAGVVARRADPELGRLVGAMTDSLAHRGPDGEGFWIRGAGLQQRSGLRDCQPSEVVFGHRRLSIVDLEGGDQPLANEDGTVWVSYNGEIYNHVDLRGELERLGHRFATRCDTEVLVHGWEEWGTGLFGRLNGIFAFVLADERSGDVLLVRDPLGVKPLYLGAAGGLTWWSSELAAARAAGAFHPVFSSDGLRLYLRLRFVPSPWTIFESVWKIPPGHFVRIRSDRAGQTPVFERYDAVVRSAAAPSGATEWAEAIMSELEAAVRRQLMADVPVASLLSGGVDSSLVTQWMTRGLAYAPRSYGIGFASDGDASEALAARRAAEALEVPHDSRELDDAGYIAAWPDALRQIGEPIANSGALMVRLLCEQVGRSHKVVLTGQGADEPLGGYPRHVAERLFPVGRLLPSLSAGLAERTMGRESGDRLAVALREQDPAQRFAAILTVFPPDEVDRLVPSGSAPTRELTRAAIARWDPHDGVNELLRIDARMSLADDLLLIADHFSMHSSVELRVPFLDLQFLELVERMPSRYKISALGRRKWLYRRAAVERLPQALRADMERTGSRLAAKRGFSTPLDAWFLEPGGPLSAGDWAGPLTELDLLSKPALARTLDSGRPGYARRRATLYSLARWAEGLQPMDPAATLSA